MKSIFFSFSKFSLIALVFFIVFVVSAVNKDNIPEAVSVVAFLLLVVSVIWLFILVLRSGYIKLFKKTAIDDMQNTEGSREESKPGRLRNILIVVFLGLTALAGVGVYSGTSNIKGDIKPANGEHAINDAIIKVPSQHELLGEWNQVDIVPITYDFDSTSFWFTGTHRYIFLPDNKLRTIVIESIGKDDPENQSSAIAMGRLIPPKNSYMLNDKGILILTQEDGKKLAAIPGLFTADFDTRKYDKKLTELFKKYEPRKGDLVMTFINNKSEPLFMRIFEKVGNN